MILVTGAKGQLGFDVSSELERLGLNFIGSDIDTLEISDKKAVEAFFKENSIDAVIHCAAYTAVDKAEENEEQCFKVNYEGTKNLAEECNQYGAKMLYVSTDYVFSGEGTSPFETEDKKAPMNIYGLSKLKGEEAVRGILKNYFIVRTSWVFGEKNTNFIYTMLRVANSREKVTVVSDQVGSPTYSRHLARLLCEMITSEKYGTYHARNDNFCSWYELCKFAYEVKGKTTEIIPVTSEEYKTAAKRPKNSRLSLKSLKESGFELLPPWQEAVKEYLSNIEI